MLKILDGLWNFHCIVWWWDVVDSTDGADTSDTSGNSLFYNLPKYLFLKILEKTLLMWLMMRPQIRRIPRPMQTRVLTLLTLLIQPTPLVIPKKNCQKVAFWSYLNKHLFGLEFKIFCLHLKIYMLMSWRPTSNNSYRPFNNSRLTVYLNPQRGIWKWLIKIIAHFVLLVFNFLALTFLVGSMLLSNSKWWTVYKNSKHSTFLVLRNI